MAVKRKEAEKALEDAFYNWIGSDGFKKLQKARHLLHKYSFWNTVLLLFQRPDVTYCAGYKTWEKLGRHVKKGEKGLKVLAPITVKKEKENVKTGDIEEKTVLVGFRWVSTFDISQTEGEPINPEFEDDTPFNTKALVSALNEMGYEIKWFRNRAPEGYVKKGENIIHIREDLKPLQAASAMIHEWAHLNVNKELNKADEEIVVEAASYFALAEIGADVSDYSAKYMQSWAKSKDFKDVKRVFDTAFNLADQFVNQYRQIGDEVLCSIQ